MDDFTTSFGELTSAGEFPGVAVLEPAVWDELARRVARPGRRIEPLASLFERQSPFADESEPDA
jgi:hypothetical protein